MALSYCRYVADGTTNVFSVSFPYISTSHVEVYKDGALQSSGWSWATGATIQFTVAPANGVVVLIKRNTPKDQRLVDFTDGNMVFESELDKNTSQMLYIVQEAYDAITSTLQVSPNTAQWDALGKRLENVANPVNSQDAVTKNYLETTYSAELQGYRDDTFDYAVSAGQANTNAQAAKDTAVSSRDTAVAAKDQAVTSAADALSSKNAAASSAGAAATSAGNAATSEANALASKNTAQTAATNAGTSETNANTSKNAAATSATNAGTSETNALASKNAAQTSASNAATSESRASEWADKNEDVPLSFDSSKRSAKHYAAKAAASAATIDVSNKVDKVPAANGYLGLFDASGQLISSARTVAQLDGKAAKPSSKVNGNLVQMDANGDLVNAGAALSSYATTASLGSYMAKKGGGLTNNFPIFDANGDLVNSGRSYTGYPYRQSSANGNFPTWDGNGDLVNSGYAPSSLRWNYSGSQIYNGTPTGGYGWRSLHLGVSARIMAYLKILSNTAGSMNAVRMVTNGDPQVTMSSAGLGQGCATCEMPANGVGYLLVLSDTSGYVQWQNYATQPVVIYLMTWCYVY
jgi:hypothetical protein